jgi:outer membrane protein TolC
MSTSVVALALCACLLLAGGAAADGGGGKPGVARASEQGGAALPGADGSGGFTGGSSLADYLRAAESLSPSIAGARSGHEAALAGVERVGWLPDPTVSYGHYFEEVETRVGPQTHKVGVRQRLPWFGKLFLAKDAAGERAAAASERLRATRLEVAARVTRAFAGYAYLAEAVGVTEEQHVLLASLEEVTRTRYSTGEASYGELMKSQISVARIEDSLASLRARRAPASSGLAAAVGLSDDAMLPWPEGIPDAPVLVTNNAMELFEEHGPDILALEHEVGAARHDRRLAGQAFVPDLTLGVDYIATDDARMPVDESGKDALIGTASVSVPLWFGKHIAAVRQAEAVLQALERQVEQRTHDLRAEVKRSVFELEDTARKVVLYRERLIPAAVQSVGATEASYRAGAADFDALVAAHEVALEFQLALARARADLLVNTAELARLTGDDRQESSGHEDDDRSTSRRR